MNNLFDDEPLLDATDEIPREAFSTAVAPEEIRERAWRATSGYLRRRRLLRGALRMSAAAALFAGGIGVVEVVGEIVIERAPGGCGRPVRKAQGRGVVFSAKSARPCLREAQMVRVGDAGVAEVGIAAAWRKRPIDDVEARTV